MDEDEQVRENENEVNDEERGEEEDEDEDEAVSGSPDVSLPLSDRDDLDAYSMTDHVSEDFDDSHNLSNSINFDLQAIQSSHNDFEVALSSDPVNKTKIAYVKGNIRK